MATAIDPVVWYPSPPAPFDIVTCWYPEEGATPGPELRPCLVTHFFSGKGHPDRYAVRVCFGTKNLKLMARQHLDLIVQKSSDIDMFGLALATRFDLYNTARLPWNSVFFACWNGRTSPKLGSLTEPYIKDYAFKIMRMKAAKSAAPSAAKK